MEKGIVDVEKGIVDVEKGIVVPLKPAWLSHFCPPNVYNVLYNVF